MPRMQVPSRVGRYVFKIDFYAFPSIGTAVFIFLFKNSLNDIGQRITLHHKVDESWPCNFATVNSRCFLVDFRNQSFRNHSWILFHDLSQTHCCVSRIVPMTLVLRDFNRRIGSAERNTKCFFNSLTDRRFQLLFNLIHVLPP